MNILSTCTAAAGPIPQTTAWLLPLGNKPAGENATSAAKPPREPPASNRSLHRLSEVRRREGLSRRKLARDLGVSVREVKRQEQPSSDMLLSDLYRWGEVLKVPATELLNEPGVDLSPPVQLRARLLRVMKTVRSIQANARQVSIRRLAAMLVRQLVEVMPELEDTAPWPVIGSRRSRRDLGQAFLRGLSLGPLMESDRSEG